MSVRPASGGPARTDVRRAPALVFVAASLLSLLLVPLHQHVLSSGSDRDPRAGPFADFAAAVISLGGEPEAFDQADADAWGRFFRTNRALKQHLDDLERELEQVSRIKERAYPVAQWLLLAYGGTGNERVIPGDGGWLYLRGGFDYLTGPPFLDPSVLRRRRLAAPAWQPALEPDPRPAILDFARQLERRGIHLLILPAPTKAMVHPEPLTGRESASNWVPHNLSFEAFRAELEAAGITVFDPAPAMIRAHRQTGQDQFLRTDSHWSPEGLDTVAGALADRIRQLGPLTGTSVRHRRQAREVKGVGDLERTLLLPPWQRLFKPQTVRVQRVGSAGGRLWRSDPRAEILLLGDSFTNVFGKHTLDIEWGRSAGLAEQLSYYLERPVERLAVNAGDASASRRRLAEELAGGRDRLAGKKLVVFQFAVRDLAIGDWQVMELAGGR